jgi:hypothetical protein
MTRLPMSSAAAALLRALLARAPEARNRILLTEYRSVDWQSLTFVGERHQFRFRISGPDADRVLRLLTANLADAEFVIPRSVVADIAVEGEPVRERDGSISFGMEALTIAE